MDSRIIEFLRSGCCDCVATVTVCKDEKAAIAAVKGLKGYEVNGSASARVIGSGVSVGEVWGLLPLDERLLFLDQC